MAVSTARFEAEMLQHLDAAYNLARHLTRHPQDAEDVVQEAYLRALKYFDGFRGANARAWLLAIVRHTAWSRQRKNRVAAITTEFNEALHSEQVADRGPERDLARSDARQQVEAALDQLPAKFREVLVLRELEDLSYEEISRVVRSPVGTVMSRLSRARERFQQLLRAEEAS